MHFSAELIKLHNYYFGFLSMTIKLCKYSDMEKTLETKTEKKDGLWQQ